MTGGAHNGAPHSGAVPPPYLLDGALDGRSPLLFSSPHSGTYVPADFVTRLPRPWLRRIEDAHMDALARPAAHGTGAPLIMATHARAVIDLNRAEDEYDPQAIDGPMPHPPRITERVRAGYGLVPRIIGPQQEIAAGPTSAAMVRDRIERLHRPYHAALLAGIEAARHIHGYAILVDCHSMPSLGGGQRANVVLGDLHGHSAAPILSASLHRGFTAHGLHVARNHPYAGGFIARSFGRPEDGIHVIQIELDRALYMECDNLAPHAGFARLARLLADVMAGFVTTLPGLAPLLRGTGPRPMAAE